MSANTEHRPVIGISCISADSISLQTMMTQIASTGAVPIFLGNHAKRKPEDDIAKIDGLIVLGNARDIDPSRYGEEPHKKTISEATDANSQARAEYEFAMIKNALECSMPILGVCGGMQRINVACGGSLHQNIPDLIKHDDNAQQQFGIAPFIPIHPIHIEKGSALADIADSKLCEFAPQHNGYVYNENSLHHQAVNRVGEGLKAVAFSEDKLDDDSKLIEAIESDANGKLKDQFILGVQWHPEYSASELGAKIAKRFSLEAQKFALANKQAHPPEQAAIENLLSSSNIIIADDGLSPKPEGFIHKILHEIEKKTYNFSSVFR